jgi:hypothetical protein
LHYVLKNHSPPTIRQRVSCRYTWLQVGLDDYASGDLYLSTTVPHPNIVPEEEITRHFFTKIINHWVHGPGELGIGQFEKLEFLVPPLPCAKT